jgi:hypothetical protein
MKALRSAEKTTAKIDRRKSPSPDQLERLKQHGFRPGVSGNPGGRPAKVFTAALLRIVERKVANDPEGRALIDLIAQRLVDKAKKGDLGSIRELASRLEGAPTQALEHGGDGIHVQILNMTPEQKRARVQQILAKARGID